LKKSPGLFRVIPNQHRRLHGGFYNVWDRNANKLWKGGTPREEVDLQVALNAVKLRKKEKTTLRNKEK